MTQTSSMTVPRRFNGPPVSGNGGWVSGALAAWLPGASIGRTVSVTLRQPPPLDTDIELHLTDTGAVLGPVEKPIAEASYADAAPLPVAPVTRAEAVAAEAGFGGHRSHPFAGCFVCGTDRGPGDGLRIFAGPVAAAPGEAARAAATWTPTEGTVPIVWAALDCPSAWASDLDDRPLVLGRITALVDRLPAVGEPHVVVGEVLAVEGRKTFTASTLYDGDGEVVATAEQIWFAIDPADFG